MIQTDYPLLMPVDNTKTIKTIIKEIMNELKQKSIDRQKIPPNQTQNSVKSGFNQIKNRRKTDAKQGEIRIKSGVNQTQNRLKSG